MSITEQVLPRARIHAGSPPIAVQRQRRDATLDLDAELRRSIRGEVRFDRGSRALYATDLSIYRHVPIGVVVPRDAEDVIATVEACRARRVPILGRGLRDESRRPVLQRGRRPRFFQIHEPAAVAGPTPGWPWSSPGSSMTTCAPRQSATA